MGPGVALPDMAASHRIAGDSPGATKGMTNMLTRPLSKTLLLLLALSLGAIGCSQPADVDEETAGSNDMENIDLNKEFGGLSYSDEAPAFGDDALLAEAMAADAVALTDAVDDSLVDPDHKVVRLYLRALWGRLDGRPETDSARDENAFTRVDWDGGMSVEGAVLVVRKPILFERLTDRILPRSDRMSVEWESKTGPHFDGVLVCISARLDGDGVPMGSLTFKTGPLTQTFRLSELDGLDATFDTDIEGNSVSFVGFTRDVNTCPRGFLAGYWQQRAGDDRDGGWFRGRLANADGRTRAFIAGRFGVNDAGERVFRGKIIGWNGNILGLVGGHYVPNGDGSGHFMGRWVTRNRVHHGELKGRYESIPGRGAGFFQGVWEKNCVRE